LAGKSFGPQSALGTSAENAEETGSPLDLFSQRALRQFSAISAVRVEGEELAPEFPFEQERATFHDFRSDFATAPSARQISFDSVLNLEKAKRPSSRQGVRGRTAAS